MKIEDMSPGMLKAYKNLVKNIGKKGGSITSMTISTNIPGLEPVTIDKEVADKITRNVNAELQRRKK